MLMLAGEAAAQAPAPPRMLVPDRLRPGEVAPDPGIAVPERVLPAPQAGGEARLPPAASGPAGRREAEVPPGGGDPGILAPMPPARAAQPPAPPKAE